MRMPTDSVLVTIHMVASLDGFIARKDNSVSWFETTDHYDKGIDGESPDEFLKTIDCYVMGSRTYEHAVELAKSHGWAYGDKPTIVVTERTLPAYHQHIEFYSGKLDTLVKERLRPKYKNAWVVGGASLTRSFIQAGLVDEIRISILPILLGEGLPFFDQIGRETKLHLKEALPYKSGMVELCYEVVRA